MHNLSGAGASHTANHLCESAIPFHQTNFIKTVPLLWIEVIMLSLWAYNKSKVIGHKLVAQFSCQPCSDLSGLLPWSITYWWHLCPLRGIQIWRDSPLNLSWVFMETHNQIFVRTRFFSHFSIVTFHAERLYWKLVSILRKLQLTINPKPQTLKNWPFQNSKS